MTNRDHIHPIRSSRRTTTWLGSAVALTVLLGLSACNNCEKLTEKVCADLGAEDCATWKELDGPSSIAPKGRRPNNVCGTMLSNEISYDGTVQSARGTVLAHLMKEAATSGDEEAMEKLKERMAENKKAIDANLEKLKNR